MNRKRNLLSLEELPSQRSKRVKNTLYISKDNKKIFWDGKILKCEHRRQRVDVKTVVKSNL